MKYKQTWGMFLAAMAGSGVHLAVDAGTAGGFGVACAWLAYAALLMVLAGGLILGPDESTRIRVDVDRVR